MEKLSIIIRNALIVDGTGAKPWIGDVGVRGDKIEAIDATLNQNAYIEMDARGHALSPGFIDAHTHDDKAVLIDPSHLCKLSQGVTTVVVGNCGISLAPIKMNKPMPSPLDIVGQEQSDFFETFKDYFEAIAKNPPSVNIVAQVGHSSLRYMAMDNLSREATRVEIQAMQKLLARGLEDGAAGFSSGLEYPTASHSHTEEMVALTDVLHQYGGFYSTHMRNEGEKVLDSISETLSVGKWSRVPVIISHHKLAGISNHGRSVETLAAIDVASRTQIVNLDAYPYVASSTVLDATRVKRASKTLIAFSTPFPEYSGRDFADIISELGLSLEDCIAKLSPCVAIYFSMNEDDVKRILSHPATMIGSDGIPDTNHPHPRLWGTFPKILGHYVRDAKIFTLEKAVQKMTGLPAQVFGLKNRGILQEGAYADMVLFNQATIKDTATFEKPIQHAKGIDGVWVNGKMSYSRGKSTGSYAGRALKRQDLKRLLWSV